VPQARAEPIQFQDDELVGGWPIFKEAAENIVARRMTMELSMSIAIVAAAAIGEFFTASSLRCSCWWPKCSKA
jgi:cation transport ATPase